MTILKTLTETASAIGDRAKQTGEDIARSAGKKLDAGRDEMAERLHTSASSVRTTGRQGAEVIDRIAMGTADQLDSTASYIEDCDLNSVFNDIRQFVRRHPTRSLMAAAGIGFLAGAVLRPRMKTGRHHVT